MIAILGTGLLGGGFVPPAEAATLFDHFNPGTSLRARLDRMASGVYEAPSWELAMACKDVGLIAAEAAHADISLAVLPAIAARMDALIAEGAGASDWTVIAREFVK